MPIIGQISVGDGATFTPAVDSDGVISWTNNKNLTNPASVDIPQAVMDRYQLAPTSNPTFTGTVTAGDITASGTITGNLTGTASANLPLSGGTMTGSITAGNTVPILRAVDNSWTQINGATTTANGANIILFGKDESREGAFWLTTNDGNVTKQLIGKADGTLTWNGKSVQTSDTIVMEQKTVSYTLAANGSEQKSVSVAKTGYTALGIVGVYPTSNSVAIQSFNISSTTAYVKLKNLTATAIASTNMYVNVLYIKV